MVPGHQMCLVGIWDPCSSPKHRPCVSHPWSGDIFALPTGMVKPEPLRPKWRIKVHVAFVLNTGKKKCFLCVILVALLCASPSSFMHTRVLERELARVVLSQEQSLESSFVLHRSLWQRYTCMWRPGQTSSTRSQPVSEKSSLSEVRSTSFSPLPPIAPPFPPPPPAPPCSSLHSRL